MVGLLVVTNEPLWPCRVVQNVYLLGPRLAEVNWDCVGSATVGVETTSLVVSVLT